MTSFCSKYGYVARNLRGLWLAWNLVRAENKWYQWKTIINIFFLVLQGAYKLLVNSVLDFFFLIYKKSGVMVNTASIKLFQDLPEECSRTDYRKMRFPVGTQMKQGPSYPVTNVHNSQGTPVMHCKLQRKLNISLAKHTLPELLTWEPADCPHLVCIWLYLRLFILVLLCLVTFCTFLINHWKIWETATAHITKSYRKASFQEASFYRQWIIRIFRQLLSSTRTERKRDAAGIRKTATSIA